MGTGRIGVSVLRKRQQRPWTEWEEERLAMMVKRGKMVCEIAEALNRSERGIALKLAHMNKPKGKEQLCWSCKHATDGRKCPWAAEFRPVPGWKATRSQINTSNGNGAYEYMTYSITECPLFEEG